MDNKQDFEKIKDKLLKLKSLAERGYKGEAIAAKESLERLLDKHGLTMESLVTEEKKWYWIKIDKNKYSEKILMQCYYHVLDVRKCEYKKYKYELGFELTAFEYAELMNAYNWHYNQFKKELSAVEKNLFTAYVHKHSILPVTPNDDSNDDDSNDDDSKEIDLEELYKILSLMDNLENISYHKQLGTCQ